MPAAPVLPDAQARRDLGVAWMNRGHALLLTADTAAPAAALDAYEQAIALLRQLPVDENPAWATSLGAAWMNQGLLLHRIHGTGHARAALASFDEAAAILRPLAGSHPWARRNLAGTLLNRACLLIDAAQYAGARTAAREALPLAAVFEHTDLVDADLAMKVRRTWCDALGRLLVAPGSDQDALASEASDLVDDGLDLARRWQERGEQALVALAVRLFRYGTRLYRLHQPHFLAEFIRENVALAPECRAIAREAVDAALADRPRGFLMIGDPATERHLQTQRELETLRPLFSA